ncbi:hypothetical protein KUTeg_018450 [Tegillarca granosa]|uniref:PWWP domain-containing protein n=1 Tax=Tegillarca granosa TaxID=220873 RepID=A0ABQ9EHW7_TEGGR|nr:hypothetical protein KUTeg_018450 [Tegillarca granosa]
MYFQKFIYSMDQYAVGDVVWIKIPKYPWWPAKVVPKDECPTIYTGNKPAVYVKFLNEEYFECVTDDKKIKPFDFEGKNKLVEQETCQQAPTKCNDNVKILQTQQSTEKCDTQTLFYYFRLSFDPNLSKDMCDEDEDNSDETDSDVDFPEGLSPIVGEYPISEKDIIWVSWRKYPFWPAYVSKIYRKRRHITKISVMFLGKRDEIPKILTLRYRPKKMLHFVHRDKDEFIRIGKSQEDANIKRNFTEAIELAEDYLNKKALGLLKTSELAFLFENLDENQIEHINEENWEHSDTCDDENSSFKSCTDKHNYTDTLIDKEQPVLDIMDGLSKKEQEMQLKSKQKQKDLVSFIMSEKMKTFLFDIRTGKRKSERHEKFFSRRTKVRQSLRYTGFGPIANEEQQEEIIATFIKWLIECDSYGEKSLPDAGYVMDVWIPELDTD